MGNPLQSFVGDVPQRPDSLTLGRTRPACGSAWGLVTSDARDGDHEAEAASFAPARGVAGRSESADFSTFSMSGFG